MAKKYIYVNICANHSMDSPEFVHLFYGSEVFSTVSFEKNQNIKKCPHELKLLKLKIIYLFYLYLKQKQTCIITTIIIFIYNNKI